MGMKFSKPQDTSVSSFIDRPGQYHFLVTNVEEDPKDKHGNLINGAAVKVVMLTPGLEVGVAGEVIR